MDLHFFQHKPLNSEECTHLLYGSSMITKTSWSIKKTLIDGKMPRLPFRPHNFGKRRRACIEYTYVS